MHVLGNLVFSILARLLGNIAHVLSWIAVERSRDFKLGATELGLVFLVGDILVQRLAADIVWVLVPTSLDLALIGSGGDGTEYAGP